MASTRSVSMKNESESGELGCLKSQVQMDFPI